jgi:hypothetical protein
MEKLRLATTKTVGMAMPWDRIYLAWTTFVKIIQKPHTKKQAQFFKGQEACRNDIERAFRVLEARFAIVRGPALIWDKEKPSTTSWHIV